MKQLKFKNPKLQAIADYLSGHREWLAIIILIALILLALKIERVM